MVTPVLTPLLVSIVFGVIQWGLVFAAQLTLRAASSSTARYAILDSGQNDTTIENYARVAVGPLLDGSKLDPKVNRHAHIDPADLTSSKITEVNLKYNFDLFFPFVVPGSSGGSLKLHSTTLMR